MSDSDGKGDVETGNAESEPLNGNDSSGDLKKLPETSIMEKVTGTLAAVTITSSCLAMFVIPDPYIIVGGVCASAITPYAWYQQTQLVEVGGLMETKKALEEEINTLAANNKRLKKNIEELKKTTEGLGNCEDALDELTKTSGSSIDQFEEQVEESRRILIRMKQNLKATVLNTLYTLITAADKNHDNMLDDEEVDQMIQRLQKIEGIKMQEAQFRKRIVEEGRSPKDIMQVFRDILKEEVPDGEEPIFCFENLPI